MTDIETAPIARSATRADVRRVEEIFEAAYVGYQMNERGIREVRVFVDLLGIECVCDAMRRATERWPRDFGDYSDGRNWSKWFFGICWNRINERPWPDAERAS